MEYFESPWKLDIHVGRSSGREGQELLPIHDHMSHKIWGRKPMISSLLQHPAHITSFFCKSNIHSEVVAQKSNLTLYYGEGLFIKLSKWSTTSSVPTDTCSASNNLILRHTARKKLLKKIRGGTKRKINVDSS